MFLKKYGDIIISIFFIIISVLMIIAAKALPKSTIMEIGPDFMPLVIAGFTLVIAILLLIISIRGLKKRLELLDGGKDDSDYKRVCLSFLSILAYTFILNIVGFIITTILYLPIQMLILAPQDKRSKKDVVLLCMISIIFTFFVFFLFRYGFKILLPAGIFTINL